MSNKPKQPVTAGGCDPCGSGRRNRYFRDKRLHVADYVIEQDFHIGRRRLVNRAMLGWGVVEGFALTLDDGRLEVAAGLAIDPCGREVVACEPAKLADPDAFVWLGGEGKECDLRIVDPPAAPALPDDDYKPKKKAAYALEAKPGLYLLCAHYAEKPVDAVRIEEDCGGARCEPNHTCETVVYSLRPVACCPAGLPGCRCHACAGEARACCEDEPVSGCAALERGPQRLLAGWSQNARNSCCGSAKCAAPKLVEHHCLSLDPNAGVPLACVEVGFHCNEPRIEAIVDDASPRRLARPNEVLFDLIRGCDLVRIENVGWNKWLAAPRHVKFTDFAKMFEVKGGRPKGAVRTKFSVDFTGPVLAADLTPDVFTMTLLRADSDEDIASLVRVPVAGIVATGSHPGDPPGTARGFTIEIASGFWVGEIERRTRSGFASPTTVEIEVRCEFISDCNRQMVTGGGRGVPSNGTIPGQRFLSTFTVVPDDQHAAYGADQSAQEA